MWCKRCHISVFCTFILGPVFNGVKKTWGFVLDFKILNCIIKFAQHVWYWMLYFKDKNRSWRFSIKLSCNRTGTWCSDCFVFVSGKYLNFYWFTLEFIHVNFQWQFHQDQPYIPSEKLVYVLKWSKTSQKVSQNIGKVLKKKIVIVIVQQICRRHPSALQEATHV